MSAALGKTLSSAEIEALLAAAEYQAHPLRAALQQLFEQMQAQVRQLDRITRISDGFQSAARQESSDLTERLNRHIRQIERIARISDRSQGMLQELNAKLERESTHDALTGLPNRRLAMRTLREHEARRTELAEAAEAHEPAIWIAIADVDHFKQVNDQFGHSAGDQALSAIAQVLAEQLTEESGGFVARWGGEEFLLLWHDTNEAAVLACAERARSAVLALALAVDQHAIPLSISIGLARARRSENLECSLRSADAALFRAKANGRNQIERHERP